MTDLSTSSSHDSRSNKEITVLSNEDVLVGRGKGFSSYIGNQKFLKTIEERKAEYKGTDDNTKKVMIARQILNEIKGKGGRFLRLVNENQRVRDVVKQGVWCEASSFVAMEKIKQALRQKRGSSGTDVKNGSQAHHQSMNGQNIENAFLPFFNNTLSPMMLSNPVSSTFVGTVGRFPLATPLLHPFFQEELIPLSHYGLYHPPSLIPSVSDLRLSLFQRALFAVQQQVDANSVHPLLVHNSMLSNNDSKSSDAIPLRIGDSDKDTSSENVTTLADDGISESFLSMFGIDATQPRVTDEQCAIEKDAMSAEERASALADMFGKNCCIDVHKDKRARKDLDVDSIAFLVRQMRSEIDSIPPDQKVALMEAQAKCSRIEEFSDKRLERFLRCEGMNTKLAAWRFTKYWECRRKLFGEDKYLMRMTLSEALKDDLDTIKDGVFCVLPIKDSSGRQLLHLEPGRKSDGVPTDSLLRSFWYIAEVMSQDNTDISSGIVILAWHPTTTLWSFDRRAYDKMVHFEQTCWPIQCICHHICCPSSIVTRIIKPIVFAFLDSRTRTRSVVHDVPQSHIAKALSEYGIGNEMLPSHMGGSVEISMNEWIAGRRASEMEEL